MMQKRAHSHSLSDFLPKNRRGQTMMIVTIIILIVSFIVILYFILRLNLGSTSNSEVCRNSVLLQARGTKYLGNNLQCKTDYVCISGGQKCTNMTASVTVNVNPNDKNEIMKAIANQLANCWYTFGEGVQYVGPSPGGGSLCGVCSIIAFDDKIQNSKIFPTIKDCLNFYQETAENSKICSALFSANPSGAQPRIFSYKEVIDYLNVTQKTEAQTYLQYLYGMPLDKLLAQPNVRPLYDTGMISTADQFAIITGESNTVAFSIFGGGTLPPVLLKTTDVSKYITSQQCARYITQA